MYRYQLIDARNSLALKSIAGLCTDTDEFVAILNEAMRRLCKRGNWFGMETLVRFCIYNGCLTLPRYVGTLMGVRFCRSRASEIQNHWYAIIGPRLCEDIFRASSTVTEVGLAPIYNDITGEDGKYIRIFPTKIEDAGKTITLFGSVPGKQPIQQKINGAWQRGYTLTLQSPYVQTPFLVKNIYSVVRQATQANVLMYEFDTASATLRDLALYEPTETNPQYRRYKINNWCAGASGCEDDDGVQWRTVEALVKMEFIPVVNDEDFLAIDDFDALKMAIQSIRLEDANQDEAAEVKMVKAVREMNFRERDKLPGMQTVVRVNPVGHSIVSPM